MRTIVLAKGLGIHHRALLVSDSVVATIPHVNNTRGIAITRDARFDFVTNVGSSTVTVVDLSFAEIAKVIRVGTMPIDCSGNLSYLWISIGGSFVPSA